jgi:hypothetical protein
VQVPAEVADRLKMHRRSVLYRKEDVLNVRRPRTD